MTRPWWEDEADNPAIPGRYVIFFDPFLIDAAYVAQLGWYEFPGMFYPMLTPRADPARAFVVVDLAEGEGFEPPHAET